MNDLVVIRTFLHEFEANVALSQLQAAGIQAMLLTEAAAEPPAGVPLPQSAGFGLAVHHRDADRATDLLTPPPSPT